MKKVFNHGGTRVQGIGSARRVLALALALMLLVPANLAGVLAEAVQAPICGLEAHVHTDACYQDVLVCETEESEPVTETVSVYVGALAAHVHTGACYSGGKLTCGIVEGKYYHQHNEYCLDEAGNLVCGLKEIRPHTHGSACYTEQKKLVCDKKESEGHQHSDKCYEEKKELTCDKKESEGHVHSDKCYTVTQELTCEKKESKGHVHKDECYTVTKELAWTRRSRTAMCIPRIATRMC